MARKKNRQTLTKSSSSGSSKGPKRSGKGKAKPAKVRTKGRAKARRTGRPMGGGAKKRYAGGKGQKTKKR